jgi:hypothetical protein
MKTRSQLATTVVTGALGPKLPPFQGEVTMNEPEPRRRRAARLVRSARRWGYAAAPVVLLATTVLYAAAGDPKIPEAVGD